MIIFSKRGTAMAFIAKPAEVCAVGFSLSVAGMRLRTLVGPSRQTRVVLAQSGARNALDTKHLSTAKRCCFERMFLLDRLGVVKQLEIDSNIAR